mmetsp:Transcript_119040/g.297018  ORF Transcript_119040/g.297018 Transcript_119040/m.297018 type:complete len:202 (-) Transcript_119040:420-1025(-)
MPGMNTFRSLSCCGEMPLTQGRTSASRVAINRDAAMSKPLLAWSRLLSRYSFVSDTQAWPSRPARATSSCAASRSSSPRMLCRMRSSSCSRKFLACVSKACTSSSKDAWSWNRSKAAFITLTSALLTSLSSFSCCRSLSSRFFCSLNACTLLAITESWPDTPPFDFRKAAIAMWLCRIASSIGVLKKRSNGFGSTLASKIK